MTAQFDLLAPLDRLPPKDPLDRLLATPADRTVLDNLPDFPDVDAFEGFLFGHVALLDCSGPVSALAGTTLDRWGEVRRVLAIAWADRPRRERPPVCTMARPPLDRERRRSIRKAAAQYPWEERT